MPLIILKNADVGGWIQSYPFNWDRYLALELEFQGNSYFYIEKWTFKVMCEVYYRAKRDKKEAT